MLQATALVCAAAGGLCSGFRSPLRSGPKAMRNGGGGVLEDSGMPAPLTTCWPCAHVLIRVFPSAHLSRHNAAHAHDALAAESQRESLPHLSKRHLNEFRSRISLEQQTRLAAHRSSPGAPQLHQSLPEGGTRCHWHATASAKPHVHNPAQHPSSWSQDSSVPLDSSGNRCTQSPETF